MCTYKKKRYISQIFIKDCKENQIDSKQSWYVSCQIECVVARIFAIKIDRNVKIPRLNLPHTNLNVIAITFLASHRNDPHFGVREKKNHPKSHATCWANRNHERYLTLFPAEYPIGDYIASRLICHINKHYSGKQNDSISSRSIKTRNFNRNCNSVKTERYQFWNKSSRGIGCLRRREFHSASTAWIWMYLAESTESRAKHAEIRRKLSVCTSKGSYPLMRPESRSCRTRVTLVLFHTLRLWNTTLSCEHLCDISLRLLEQSIFHLSPKFSFTVSILPREIVWVVEKTGV